MYVYLSKILPAFFMPLSLVALFVLLALLFLRRGQLRVVSGLLILALVTLWIASTPFVAQQLYRSIESRFPPVPMNKVPVSGCMVVLGGVVGAALPPRLDVDLYESIDRVIKTAELYRAGKAPLVIVTGGNQPWSESEVAEADLIRQLLMQWGVPKDAIFLEGSSRNTRENALYSKNIIDAVTCNKVLLVTSAAHMPRAVAAFKNVGVQVFPVSTDVRATAFRMPGLMDFVPSAGALATTSDAIREWIGQKVYSWNGWD